MNELLVLATSTTSLGGPAEIWGHIVRDFSNIGSPTALAAFLQVLMIDIVLAGDNAIVVGALAHAGMGQRTLDIGEVRKMVAEALFQIAKALASALNTVRNGFRQSHRLRTHSTLKILDQRISDGQRQIASGCALLSTEKKMMRAGPTRFS